MASKALTIVYVVALLLCGSLNTITMKISYTMEGVGVNGQPKLFQKPWFTTFAMFVSMAYALFFSRCPRHEPVADVSPGGHSGSKEAQSTLSYRKKIALVSIPAVFDILATGLCSMGFLYIPASVWQLLRGAEMVFAALFAVIFLRRRLQGYHWIGILLCIAGITLVGLASVWGEEATGKTSSNSEAGKGSSLLLLGMGLALAGQVVQAAQVIAEEWLLKEVDLPGTVIVGFEGVWGALIMLATVFPLLWILPGTDNGHLEDEVDTIAMLKSSAGLLCMTLIYTASCCTYNMAGIAVTDALSAVHRVMLEALRTAVVWGFGLTVHYVIDPSSSFGEKWTPYSVLEVIGFVLLILGQATYGAMLQIPGLDYSGVVPEVEMMKSPGSMRNFASPLPPDRKENDGDIYISVSS